MKRTIKPEIKKFLKSQNGEKFLNDLTALRDKMKDIEWLDKIKNKPGSERSVTDFFE